LGATHLQHGHNVRVIELGDNAGFLEPRLGRLGTVQVSGDLDRHLSLQLRIVGEVHRAKPTPAKGPLDLKSLNPPRRWPVRLGGLNGLKLLGLMVSWGLGVLRDGGGGQLVKRLGDLHQILGKPPLVVGQQELLVVGPAQRQFEQQELEKRGRLLVCGDLRHQLFDRDWRPVPPAAGELLQQRLESTRFGRIGRRRLRCRHVAKFLQTISTGKVPFE
jgi:hypothetical protein